MKLEKINLETTGNFSPLFINYLSNHPSIKTYFNLPPVKKSFAEQIKRKEFSLSQRELLVHTLQEQYKDTPINNPVKENISSLLESTTFTVTTGHQLNIFTGPLYFVYKIVTIINACKELKKEYPQHNFVPVYWMASEDHDFEEISKFRLFGKTYQWRKADAKGAVGRLAPNEIAEILEELPEPIPVFENAYKNNATLSAAVRQYVNELFGRYGVVVLDADHPQLKRSFKDIIKDDLLHHYANKLVEETSTKLNELGYSSQIFPREINFFYLKENLRERIVREEDQYKVLNTDISFALNELLAELDEHPERFSPNVVMRPLLQEFILPNLAYVGGPAEVAYWLQLKPVFAHYKIPFPILMPRNFALVVGKAVEQKVEKLNLSTPQLFKDTNILKEEFIQANAEQELSLEEESKRLAEVFEAVKQKAISIDGSLEGFVGAEASKSFKSLQNIEKRIKKAEEQKQETHLRQLDNIKDKLFPGGNLQERVDNFLNFYINDPEFIDRLVQLLDPFDYRFNILTYAE